MERLSMHMDLRQGWGMQMSWMKVKASCLDVKVFQRRELVTRSSPAHRSISSASDSLKGLRVILDESMDDGFLQLPVSCVFYSTMSMIWMIWWSGKKKQDFDDG